MTPAASTLRVEGLEQKHCYTHEVSSENTRTASTLRVEVSSGCSKGLERKHVYTHAYTQILGFLYIFPKMCEVDVSEGCSPYLIQMQTRK